jgi:hypothetical protein
MSLRKGTVALLAAVGVVGAASADVIQINFQPSRSDLPPGYHVDAGDIFADRGNGFSYGWEVDNVAARDRNSAAAPDQRYDTLIFMQRRGDHVWEIALDDGLYDIFLVAGDPAQTRHVNTFDVEGTILIDPDGEDYWDEYSLTVEVTDGRLTVAPAAGSRRARIDFIDITPVFDPVPEPAALFTIGLGAIAAAARSRRGSALLWSSP